MKRYFVFLSFLLGINMACADCTPSNNQCENVTIDKIYARGNNQSLLIKTSGDQSLLTCNQVNSNYLQLESSSVAYKELFALLMSTYNRNDTVTIRLSNSGDCNISYIVLEQN